MLRSLTEPEGYRLSALDGEIGHCSDFLFDDRKWTVRYMVADTGGWLSGRKVLVSPEFLDSPEWETRHFPVRLERNQIEDSPPLDSNAPVSRRYERAYHDFFSAPYYWVGTGLWGQNPYPGMIASQQLGPAPREDPDLNPEATHLRSVREVTRYSVVDTKGNKAGQVKDFVFDDADWSLRYFVVDTSWLPFSKEVLVPTDQIDDVDWVDRTIRVSVTEDQIGDAPEYDSRAPVNEAQETVLYDYYGRPRGRPLNRD